MTPDRFCFWLLRMLPKEWRALQIEDGNGNWLVKVFAPPTSPLPNTLFIIERIDDLDTGAWAHALREMVQRVNPPLPESGEPASPQSSSP